MLFDLAKMADEAAMYVLVMSRPLTANEQEEALAIVDAWLLLWSVSNQCPASRCRSLFEGQILVWAVDLRPREQRGVGGGLSGSELDLLFGPLRAFGDDLNPPVKIALGEAVIVDGQAVPSGFEWRKLQEQGRLAADTLIIRPAPVAVWRQGRFVHRVGDDADWAEWMLKR